MGECMEMGRRVIVIGGGASGMMAAIQAARRGAQVTVTEQMDRVGKKLLSTGNGRCNFTNLNQRPEYYRCSRADFPWQVVERFPVGDTLAFFGELGILPKDRNGYIYPYSDQASSVLDVLRMELEHLGVALRTGCAVREIRKTANGPFSVRTGQGLLEADALILAAGSKAAPATGSDGSGYELARRLGHRILTPLPALVQLRCAETDYKQMAGVRTEAKVTLFERTAQPEAGRKAAGPDGGWKQLAEDTGELQLTEYGISGIPVFQVSRYASSALYAGKQVKAVVDFLPGQSREETAALIKTRRETMPEKSCEQWMIGLLNKKLSMALLKRAGLSAKTAVCDVPERGWNALLGQLRAFETRVTASNSFEQAQVCCGGVDTAEVDPATMESGIVPGLYLAGEILDVDGICGGYNLQWAWSSGAVAGRAAAAGTRIRTERQKAGR